MKPTNRPDNTGTSRRDATALALLGAMLLALAMVGSASLSAIGSGSFQQVLNAIGLGTSPVIESEQRRQAAVLDSLGRIVHNMSADVGSLNARIKQADSHEAAVSDRFALVDADIAALSAEVRSLRTARAQTASEPWREPVDRVDTEVAATRSDLVALRSSLDGFDQTYRKDINTITKRLDRLEQSAGRDLTSSLRPQVRKKQVRHSLPLPATVAGTAMWGDGTIPQNRF